MKINFLKECYMVILSKQHFGMQKPPGQRLQVSCIFFVCNYQLQMRVILQTCVCYSVAITVASYLYYPATYPTILEYTIVIAITVATS